MDEPELKLAGLLATQSRVDSIRCSTEAGSGHPTLSPSVADWETFGFDVSEASDWGVRTLMRWRLLWLSGMDSHSCQPSTDAQCCARRLPLGEMQGWVASKACTGTKRGSPPKKLPVAGKESQCFVGEGDTRWVRQG